MTAIGPSRRNPIQPTAISWRQMDDEIHIIQEFSELPGVYGIELQDLPNPNAIAIYEVDTTYTTGSFTGLTEFDQITVGLPSPGQFRVGSGFSSKVIFNLADDGKTVVVDYEGGGSVVSIDNINTIIGTLSSTFASLTASTSSGIQMRANDNTTVSAVFGVGGTSDMEVENKIRARTSAGILFEANGGTDVLTLGAGGGSNATFAGGVNVTGLLSPNGRLAFPSGSASAPSIYPTGDDNTGIYPIGADELGIATGGAERARFGSYGVRAPGLIIQSVYSANSFQTTTTGVTYTDVLSAIGTTWEITITPKSAASVINLFANLQLTMSRAAATQWAGILIQRKIGAGAYATIYTPTTDSSGPVEITFSAAGATAVEFRTRYPLFLRDTPATTSAVSYKFQIRNRVSTNTPVVTINEDTTTDGQSFVILNEVAV